jgi:hypothetical protein
MRRTMGSEQVLSIAEIELAEGVDSGEFER